MLATRSVDSLIHGLHPSLFFGGRGVLVNSIDFVVTISDADRQSPL
jgi:hypothetical protein